MRNRYAPRSMDSCPGSGWQVLLVMGHTYVRIPYVGTRRYVRILNVGAPLYKDSLCVGTLV